MCEKTVGSYRAKLANKIKVWRDNSVKIVDCLQEGDFYVIGNQSRADKYYGIVVSSIKRGEDNIPEICSDVVFIEKDDPRMVMFDDFG